MASLAGGLAALFTFRGSEAKAETKPILPEPSAREGDLLAVSEEGSFIPADCWDHKMVVGVQGAEGPQHLHGIRAHVRFDEPLEDHHLGRPVFLTRDGCANMAPPRQPGMNVIMVGILLNKQGEIVYQPQFVTTSI